MIFRPISEFEIRNSLPKAEELHEKGEAKGRDELCVLARRRGAISCYKDDFASPCALQSRATAAVQVFVAASWLGILSENHRA